MRIFGAVLFLMVAIFPLSLYAQQGGAATGTTAAQGTGNQSAQGGFVGSTQGGFIGVSASNSFVGVHEIYNRTTTRSTSTSRGVTAATRPRAATTAMQRQPGSMLGATQGGSLGNQAVRTATSLDFAPPGFGSALLSMQRPLPMIETNLTRIQGIQDSQIVITNAPVGTTAVLTGSVASDRERRVAQQLLLLEPGINRVENRLEVR